MVYLVSYDLNKPGKDYEAVYQAIKDASDGTWCHYGESTWLIRTSISTADAVFSKIEPHLDKNDTCLVIEVKNNKQGWLTKEMWDHIDTYIFG